MRIRNGFIFDSFESNRVMGEGLFQIYISFITSQEKLKKRFFKKNKKNRKPGQLKKNRGCFNCSHRSHPLCTSSREMGVHCVVIRIIFINPGFISPSGGHQSLSFFKVFFPQLHREKNGFTLQTTSKSASISAQ